MKSKNHFEIRGYVGNNPEIKESDNGSKRVNLSIATEEVLRDKEGNKTKVAHWHNITLWNGNARFAAEHVKKGALVAIEGKIKPRKTEGEKGQNHYSLTLQVDTFDLLHNKEEN